MDMLHRGSTCCHSQQSSISKCSTSCNSVRHICYRRWAAAATDRRQTEVFTRIVQWVLLHTSYLRVSVCKALCFVRRGCQIDAHPWVCSALLKQTSVLSGWSRSSNVLCHGNRCFPLVMISILSNLKSGICGFVNWKPSLANYRCFYVWRYVRICLTWNGLGLILEVCHSFRKPADSAM